MKGKSELRLPRLIPCLFMPPLCAGLYLAVSRTGLFFRLYIALFGWDEVGPGLSYLCFPLLALLTGIVPAVLLSALDRSPRSVWIWTAWTALFFALFFTFEVIDQTGLPTDPALFFFLWIPGTLFAFLFQCLPLWIASAVRALALKHPR